MQHDARHRFLGAALSMLVIACGGCRQDTPAQASPSAAVTDQAAKPLVVDEIVVAAAASDAQARTRPQTPGDPIVVSVKTSGTSAGADLEVKLFELKNGQQAAIQTRRIKTDGATTTELTFKREQPWNPGRYLVEVKLDGKLAGQRDVDVVDLPPEAPAAKP